MARAFARASSQYMEYGGSVIGAYPITLAGWFNSTDQTNGQTIVSLGKSSVNNVRVTLILGGHIAGDPLQYYIQNGVSTSSVVTTAGYASGTWQHGCAVSSATNAHAVYLNGGSKGTGVSNVTFPAPSTTDIGCDATSPGRTNYNNGLLAEVAIWAAALTDAEVAILALGYSPLMVRPASLISYWPLIGNYSPEIDVVGGNGMTLGAGAAAPTKADHSRVLYAVKPGTLKATYVAPPAGGGQFLAHGKYW